MSLNKTLDRLFDEIRREAKRNPDFANRLDAVLQLHDSRRDVPDGVVEEIASADASSSPASGGGAERSEAEGRVEHRYNAPLSLALRARQLPTAWRARLISSPARRSTTNARTDRAAARSDRPKIDPPTA